MHQSQNVGSKSTLSTVRGKLKHHNHAQQQLVYISTGARAALPCDICQGSAGELLQHLLQQSCVLDFEAAPKRVQPPRRKIERKLAKNSRLSRTSWASDDGQLTASQALDDLRKSRKRLQDGPAVFERVLQTEHRAVSGEYDS